METYSRMAARQMKVQASSRQDSLQVLLIVCEEGEVEYEEAMLKKTRTVCEYIEEQLDFTLETLLALEKKHKPEHIIIEWNGMWNFKEMKLPWHWKVEQTIFGQLEEEHLVASERLDGLVVQIYDGIGYTTKKGKQHVRIRIYR